MAERSSRYCCRSLRSPDGASSELLGQILVGERVAMARVPLFAEYEAVMSRPQHLKAAGTAVDDVRNPLDVLASVIEPVEIRYVRRLQLVMLMTTWCLNALRMVAHGIWWRSVWRTARVRPNGLESRP